MIDEPIAPDAATSESHDQDLEAPAPSRDQETGCDDEPDSATNEATIGPLSVVSGPSHVCNCTGEAMVHEPRATNEATIRPLPVVSGPLNLRRCTGEAVVDEPSATNEPTAGLESVTNEPKIGPLSVVSSPLPVCSCTVEVDEPSATNEANAGLENAANEATEGSRSPAESPKTVGHTRPESDANAGDAGPVGREDDPDPDAEIEKDEPRKTLGDEIARREMSRATNIRKLNDQWWHEAEAAEAACRSRHR